jgi:hypothetical protein
MTQPPPYLDYANLPTPEQGILVTLFITVRCTAAGRQAPGGSPGLNPMCL